MASRIIFLGSSGIIERSVLWLKDSNLRFLVVTNTAQAGKCNFLNNLSASQLVIADEEFAISDWQWEAEDILISVGAPWFLKGVFIEAFPGRALLNLHGSQLPLYRGGNLFSWYVLNNVRVGMNLLHHLTARMDHGPIAFYDEFLYPASCKKPIDYIRVYEENNSLFLLQKIKDMVISDEAIPRNVQQHYLSTYWPRLRSDVNGWIDWNLEGALLERFISAFDDPYGGAGTTWRKKEIRLKNVYFQPGFNHHPFQNGIVFRNNRKWLNIAVQGGELIVCTVYAENEPVDFSKVKEGDRFITPSEKIDGSKARIIKGKNGLSIQKDW